MKLGRDLRACLLASSSVAACCGDTVKLVIAQFLRGLANRDLALGLVSPLLGPAVLKPKDRCCRVRRISLDGWRCRYFTLISREMGIRVFVSHCSLVEAVGYIRVRF